MEYKYTKQLSELVDIDSNITISNLVTDSRKRVEDGMFFCIKGLINDGHSYATSAVRNGCTCIVHSDELSTYHDDIVYIQVIDVVDELNRIARIFYNDPSSKLDVFAITGTNGKTSVASIIHDILNPYKSTGYIGTLNMSYNNKVIQAQYTTPEVIDLQEVMADMVMDNVKALAIEVSSHALIQKRVGALSYNYAVFTNLSHEHLDYHGTMDEYFEAKALLFENLGHDQYAIINADDEYGQRLLEKEIHNKVSYGIDNEADYMAKDIDYGLTQTHFTLSVKGQEYPVESNLVAKFNISNVLAAIAVLHTYGLEIEKIIAEIKVLKQISGRVERISFDEDFQVIVDYAHTPDGFLKVFEYAKSIVEDKRIISVFGSAGERDVLKRKVLGEIANDYSDMIILTADDPRNESVHDISEQIGEGITQNYIVIEDRYDAIHQAISLANKNDIILVLGKGNDEYMALPAGKEKYLGDVNIVNEIRADYLEAKRND